LGSEFLLHSYSGWRKPSHDPVQTVTPPTLPLGRRRRRSRLREYQTRGQEKVRGVE